MKRLARIRRRAGTASIELALLVPVLAAVLVGMFDWGMAIDQRLRLQSAARAGAQQALRTPGDRTAIAAAVLAAAPDFAALSVTPSPVWCECAKAATSCSTDCDGGLSRYVRVTVSHPFSPLTPAGPTSVSANVTLRLD
ncbi:TadE/TadG family type IV pilus assembly protein [Roseomonas sp. AR75]|uniref:TadE/TadG family type IV pilus assembly protein n=1 Tax=Roseomonas sp. AR75 TaxID=2562311 RepID=UPI0014856F28|nr:TadE family protein [Roseomonas sp. AR75]